MRYFLRSTAAAVLSPVFLAACLSLLSGCASIVSKSIYPLTINASPQHVNVSITDGQGAVIYEGMTPLTLPLKASSGYFKPAFYMITLSLDGYKTQTFSIEASIDGWYFGNIALGGPLGLLVIDPLTGAMWQLPSQYYNFTLAPDDEASNKGMHLLTTDQVPEHLRDQLVPLREASKN